MPHTRAQINDLTGQIIGAAISVHREMGPGLLERIYEDCLAVELNLQGISFERQKSLPLVYKGHDVGSDLKIDLLVAETVIIELKSVAELLPVHEASF